MQEQLFIDMWIRSSMYLSEEELFELLKYVNNEGAKHKRFMGIHLRDDYSPSSDFWDQFIFIFDDGPLSATSKPWPIY